VTAEPLAGGRIEAEARDLGEEDAFDLGEAGAEAGRRGTEAGARGAGASARRAAVGGWRAFLRGTAAELRAAGHPVAGARLAISGDLPRGAGLASSAALCVGLALALLGEEPEDRLELARLCSRVENLWVGAETGLLDQLAVLLAEEGHAIRLDLLDLGAAPVPLELGGWTLAVLDSGSRREHSASGYNRRRRECRQACAQLGLSSLRRATPKQAASLPAPLDGRVRHVVSENARVEDAVAALRQGDLGRLGELLDASHASLRDDYDVSTPELERAIDACRAAGAAGARLVGGGFGGSVLALYPPGVTPAPGSLVVEPGSAARLV
jgi:galactokinase